jgi:hypothetical protein
MRKSKFTESQIVFNLGEFTEELQLDASLQINYRSFRSLYSKAFKHARNLIDNGDNVSKLNLINFLLGT